MNKNLFPIIGVVTLLAIGGYYLNARKSSAPMTDNKLTSEVGEFAKAMESGKPTICIMKKGEDSIEYMIKDKSMRMNSTTTIKDDDSGKTTTTIGHMINDTKYLYMWDDKTKQGSKMAIPTEAESKEMAEKTKAYQQNSDLSPKLESQSDYDNLKNEGYSIECKSGVVDESVFAPPTDVKFIDPSEMMNALPVQDENGKFDMSQIEEIKKKYGGEIPANY